MADRFRDILHEYWGYDDFRGIQQDIIRSIASGNDTLGLMPTGGGKSITFQVPALALEGMTIVVTPLVALMKDQVDHLKRRGIRAAAIHAGMSRTDIVACLDNCVFGAYKLLYLSPERLSSELFVGKLRRMKVSFITVDEAHCISQWGYDFRPAYLEIARLREHLPDVPVLALTATATPRVVDDICDRLRFRPDRTAVFRMSFARPNLSYVVRKTKDKTAELLHILSRVDGSAIVYTRSRQKTREVAELLREKGFTALNFHAGLTELDKDVRQRLWHDDEIRVMVATNAFGMGIDKPNVRLVIHLDMPDAIEAYFQEAGRAGRDGKTAYAILLYNASDATRVSRRVEENFPAKDYIADTYDDLAYFFQLAVGDGQSVCYEFNIEKFCRVFHRFPLPVMSALQILTRAGYIEFRESEDNLSRLMFLLSRDELYRLHRQTANTEKVISTILRRYGGVFADYVFIEERMIAQQTELKPHEVYEILVNLNRQRVIHYVPRKKIPHITYLQRRVDRVVLSREVYEERRDNYEQRCREMLRYAQQEEACRSSFMLNYFGEKDTSDCGRCDVCLSKRRTDTDIKVLTESLRQQIAAAKGLAPDQLNFEGYSTTLRDRALAQLIDDEAVVMVDGRFYLN